MRQPKRAAMNETPRPAAPQRLEDAPASFAPDAASASDLRADELRGRDLRHVDLRQIPGRLLPEHLAGSDLTGNRTVPPEIVKFPALEQVKAISADARKIFIGLLAACVYSWLVIGTTTDVALILNTASSPLPIINTPIPIADFYWVGPGLLAAVYCYLHLYLMRLWRALAVLPAIFPDGTALDDEVDPWLLTGLVRNYMPCAPARPLGYLENMVSVSLAWLLVPITLFFCWRRLLPSHHIGRSAVLAFLIAFTTWFGWRTFHLARTTLRGEMPPEERARSLWGGVWRDCRAGRGQIAVFCLVIFTVMASSIIARHQSPRDADTHAVVVFSLSNPWQSLRGVDPTFATLLNFVGIRTYADLREIEVAQKPDGWDSKDWSKVKRIDLRGRNLAFADAGGAFLANADLREANLIGASLVRAELQGADFFDWGLRPAQLQGADLNSAQLQGASLNSAQLQGAHLMGAGLKDADLAFAQLQGAYLIAAQLQGAHLFDAQLQGADLRSAELQGANLRDAQLQGADFGQLKGTNLRDAQLQGADLRGAQLQGAHLRNAQLQGADLRGAALWRALVPERNWDLVDLRDSTVVPMTKTKADEMITGVSANIADEQRRRMVVEALTKTLGTGDRPSRPEFPAIWQSQPNVMFNAGDPKPEPFPWGKPTWTEQTYDEALAKFLGELACGSEVSEAQTRGLAWRALELNSPFSFGNEPGRLWPKLFAATVLGPDCPPGVA
jgi:uncharacterized protein YjbI with pentapeptide repeats